MNGRRFGTLILAGSLGLNIALGGLLIYQVFSAEEAHGDRRTSEQDRARFPWSREGHRRSLPDSIRKVPRLEKEQIRRLSAMREAMWEETAPARRQIGQLQALIRMELRGAEPNPAYLDSLTGEIGRLQRLIQSRSLRLILDEREILTPEQYERFLRWMVPGTFGPADARSRGMKSRVYPERRSGGRPPEGTPPPRPYREGDHRPQYS